MTLETLVLHEDPRSGNCYKIKLTAALLGIPLATLRYDITRGETRTPAFLSGINPNGRIPVLQIGAGEGARFLPESNAACWWLADRDGLGESALIPADRFDRADMLHWMFFEQYNHEPNVATLRFWLSVIGDTNLTETQRGQIAAKRAGGEAALKLMDDHLGGFAGTGRDWFVGSAPTLADVVLFAYTHVAEEADFDLEDYPAVTAWITRMAALPRYVAML
jgi:glutathione S-transferase